MMGQRTKKNLVPPTEGWSGVVVGSNNKLVTNMFSSCYKKPTGGDIKNTVRNKYSNLI